MPHEVVSVVRKPSGSKTQARPARETNRIQDKQEKEIVNIGVCRSRFVALKTGKTEIQKRQKNLMQKRRRKGVMTPSWTK